MRIRRFKIKEDKMIEKQCYYDRKQWGDEKVKGMERYWKISNKNNGFLFQGE